MKRPTTLVMDDQGFQQVITINSVTYDDVREEEMVLPPDIQAQPRKKP